MNTTVAVALVTSVSTLAAAAITGVISALQTARQLRHQAALVREERAGQRAERRGELRREAYERFLLRTDEAYRVLDEGWHAAPFTGTPRWDAGFAARRALDEAFVRVLMVGPDEVAERGREVIAGVGDEFRLHRRVVTAQGSGPAGAPGTGTTGGVGGSGNAGGSGSLGGSGGSGGDAGDGASRSAASADPEARRRALDVRFRTSADFVAAVRRALDGPDGEAPARDGAPGRPLPPEAGPSGGSGPRDGR